MSLNLIRLTRAVEGGRSKALAPLSREALLVTLLRKRAVARNQGAVELEDMLRKQIIWSLPVVSPAADG